MEYLTTRQLAKKHHISIQQIRLITARAEFASYRCPDTFAYKLKDTPEVHALINLWKRKKRLNNS